jgi:hypothetical protein
VEDKEKESLLFPEGGKNHKPQKAGRTQSGGNIHKMIRVFDLFEENALRSLRTLRLILFFIFGGRIIS